MKQLEKSAKIIDLLKGSVGPDVNLDDFAVFEATAINTLPLRKRHPVLKNARVGEDILHEMSERVKKESVPLQAMHNSKVLPFGRVFAGEVVNLRSNSELRVLFYLPKATAKEQIDLIEGATVDQVSVSFLSKKVLCSECGWDFHGDDATFEHHMSGTCANGHHLGEGSTHAKLIGLDTWYELSLVGRGGAQNARIHGRSSSLMKDVDRQRLTDAGWDPELLIIRLSSEDNGEMPNENLVELVEGYATAKAELTLARREVEDLKAANAALQAQVAELSGKSNKTLEEVQAEVETLKTELNAATAYLGKVATATLNAAKMAVPEKMDTVAELTANIDQAQAFLHSVIPVGGVGTAAGAEGKKIVSTRANLFKTVR